jgi:hypothetical protein
MPPTPASTSWDQTGCQATIPVPEAGPRHGRATAAPTDKRLRRLHPARGAHAGLTARHHLLLQVEVDRPGEDAPWGLTVRVPAEGGARSPGTRPRRSASTMLGRRIGGHIGGIQNPGDLPGHLQRREPSAGPAEAASPPGDPAPERQSDRFHRPHLGRPRPEIGGPFVADLCFGGTADPFHVSDAGLVRRPGH